MAVLPRALFHVWQHRIGQAKTKVHPAQLRIHPYLRSFHYISGEHHSLVAHHRCVIFEEIHTNIILYLLLSMQPRCGASGL